MDNRCLSPPERMAASVDDTRQVASLIPKMKQGVQSQGGALAAGVVEAWHLRDAYREAVNKVASEIGRRHMVAWEKAERVGHALAGARLANQESQTTETFSPAQALQAREKQLESQGKLAEGAVKALDQFQKDKERKDAFAEAGRTVAAGLAE